MLGLTSQSIGYKKQRSFKQVSEKGKKYIARKWKNVRKKLKFTYKNHCSLPKIYRIRIDPDSRSKTTEKSKNHKKKLLKFL